MARQYIQLYFSYLDAIELLGDAERGRLFTALLDYGKTGTTQELSGNEKYIFPMMKAQIDRDNDAYDDKCRENKENGRLGGRPKKPNGLKDNQTVLEKPKEKEKEKEKEKDNNPLNPPTENESGNQSPKLTQTEQIKAELRAIRNSFIFGAELDVVVNKWLKYKHERKEDYVPTGLKSFLSRIQNELLKSNYQQIINVIADSMASGYKGVTWDKINKNQPMHQTNDNSSVKKNRFVNFEGRKWDYEEMVRQERELQEREVQEIFARKKDKL